MKEITMLGYVMVGTNDIKKAATLFFIKKQEDKETGKEVIIKKYFTVFNAKEVLARIQTQEVA